MKSKTMVMDLEKLLREKPFELLDKEEKKLVLAEMTADDYGLFRQIALETENYFIRKTPPVPRPEIQTRIREQIRYNQEKTMGGRIMKMISYRVPAYQVAAAVVLLMLGVLFTSQQPKLTGSYDGVRAITALDSASMDSAKLKGINLYEDSMFSSYLIESL